MPNKSLSPKDLETYLKEFSAQAGEWFTERSFVNDYHQFIQDFFQPEKLQTAEWPDFQQLAENIHSFNSMALAKAKAFGRPNYDIQKYRESFHFLAHGPGSVEDRMRAFMGDKEAYASKFLGDSVVSELIGQLFADRFVFMNRRDIEAAAFLGIEPAFTRGDDFPAKFSKFNAALKPLFEAYGQIVRSRTSAPLGVEVDQFLSWLYETKVSVGSENPENLIPDGRQIWVFAPGPNARFWDECRAGSIALYGDDLLGDLNFYASKMEILQRHKEVYPKDTEPTNDALAAWEFSHVMKEGDLVIAKKGTRGIVGAGMVSGPYRHDPNRMKYKNTRDVKWTHTGDWLLPDGERFANKALTNITRYRDFASRVLSLIGLPPDGSLPDAGPRHYWLNFAPEIWRVSEHPVNIEETYTTHNENGNKRQVYSCFQAVKPGDLVIGYETTPIQKVSTVLEITRGIHMDTDEGECIRFKALRHLDQPRRLQELRQIPSLADCDPVKGQRKGSLFQITKAEYEAILGKTPEPEPPVTVPEDVFLPAEAYLEILDLLRLNKNVVLQGPPGVGKTFVAKRLARSLLGGQDEKRLGWIQFHQSYAYEDFIQGYRPNGCGFELQEGVFYKFCDQAAADRSRPYVFVIDEINRGNLSRIFGEALSLLEADKRDVLRVSLAYSRGGERFTIPANVHLLGLMNTADRSLAVVDYALRRRFRFVELLPQFNNSRFFDHLVEYGVSVGLARRIVESMIALNSKIALDTRNLGHGFEIGHSFFCPTTPVTDEAAWYRAVIRYEVAPLLREYWFDAPAKADEAIEGLSGAYSGL